MLGPVTDGLKRHVALTTVQEYAPPDNRHRMGRRWVCTYFAAVTLRSTDLRRG